MFWKSFRDNATGLADLLRYSHMVADGVMAGKGGELMGGFYYKGADLESASVNEVNVMMARINHMLNSFGNGWMVHCDAVRGYAIGYPPEGAFPDAVTRLVDKERRDHYEAEQGHYQSHYAIVFTYLPESVLEARGQEMLFERTGETGKITNKSLSMATLEKFKNQLGDVENTLSAVFPGLKRMRSYVMQEKRHNGESPIRLDPLMDHLHFCITGLNQSVRLPSIPMYLDTVLGSQDFIGGYEPKVGENFISVLTIEGFPAGGESYPGMLDTLNHLPVTYRFSTRFIFLDPEEARAMMDKLRKKWRQKTQGLADQVFNTSNGAVDLDALAMMTDSQAAMAEASSQMVRFGHYTATVVLMADSRDKLKTGADMVSKALRNQGFTVRIETANAIEAYLGSLPGHGKENVRRPIIHSLNLAHLLPTTSLWAGPERNPCPFYPANSPPLLFGRGAGATPFRLCLHYQDLGHTLLLGPTGAGKSTVLNLILAQHRRYEGAQIFAFDKGHAAYPLAKGAGAVFYDLGAEGSKLSFCPLLNIHKVREQKWALEWLEILFTLNGIVIGPPHRNVIQEALSRLAVAPPSARTLTNLYGALQDKELQSVLKRYLVGGAIGELLDAETDSLTDGAFQVFEMEHLMNMGDKDVIPTLLYIFHRIEQRLTGAPTIISLDEAWLLLQHSLFMEKIREWLKVLRKANAAVIFATQAVEDVANSPIAPVIFQSCPTKILLPNAEAKNDLSRAAYEKMGLTARQIEIISYGTPKRDYYYTSPEGKRLFQLELGPLTLAFVGRGGKEDLAKIKELIMQYGEDRWQGAWLRHCRLPNWAEHWRVEAEKDGVF